MVSASSRTTCQQVHRGFGFQPNEPNDGACGWVVPAGSRNHGSEVSVHDVETGEAQLGVAEGVGDRPDNFEPERLP